jgi:pimeloyl-ACP methyl ester carboxylesterase
MKITMQNMIMADQDLDPSAAKLPVTIIWGRNDGITPLSDGLKLHKAIKGSKLYIIEGARHSPIATHPGEVADIIAEIL